MPNKLAADSTNSKKCYMMNKMSTRQNPNNTAINGVFNLAANSTDNTTTKSKVFVFVIYSV